MSTSTGRDRWIVKQLEQHAGIVAATSAPGSGGGGGRNEALFRESVWIAAFAKSGWIGREAWRASFIAAGAACGLGGGEVGRTLDSAWETADPATVRPWDGGNGPPPPRIGVRPIGRPPAPAPPNASSSPPPPPPAPRLVIVDGGALPVVRIEGDPLLHCVRYAADFRPDGAQDPITWSDLAYCVREPLAADTKPLPLWGFHEIEADSRRRIPVADGPKRSPSCRAVHVVMLDYDTDPDFSPESIREWWGAVRYVAHSSRSHMKQKGKIPPGPRGRVILAISRPITPEELQTLKPWFLGCGRGGMGAAELSGLKGANRAYYVPIDTPDYWWDSNEGGALDVDALLSPPEEAEELAEELAERLELPPAAKDPATWKLLRRRENREGVEVAAASNLNADTVFRYDPRWRGRLQFCEFRSRVLLDGSPIRDEDETEAGIWLDRVYGFHVADYRVHSVWAVIARDNPTHPVREYFEGLTWDGVPRLGGWLAAYLGCDDGHREDADDNQDLGDAKRAHRALSAAMGRCWFVGAVARIFRPGVKLDTVLILIGPQGRGKSTAIRILASADWFADSSLDTRSKDSYQALNGVFLYEWAELDAMRRSEASSVKAFLSSARDHYRPSYGRNSVDVPRQVVFVGTTNEGAAIFNDPTGSRRYWPREVGRIDLDGLQRDRDQLWAEAVSLYQSGAAWWFDSALESARAVASEQYEQEDPWVEPIAAALLLARTRITLAEVLRHLDIPRGQSTASASIRAARIMRSLGWESRRARGSGQKKVREWFKT